MEKYKIRNNIRKLRFNNGEMTQEQLAEKAGVTRQTIIAIESSKVLPLPRAGLPHRPGLRRAAGRSLFLRNWR